MKYKLHCKCTEVEAYSTKNVKEVHCMVRGPHGITYYIRGCDEVLHFDVDDPKKDKLTITMHDKIGFKEGQFDTVEVPISEIPIGEINTKYYRLDDVAREWAGKISHGSKLLKSLLIQNWKQ